MSQLLGNAAYKAARKQTKKKLSPMSAVILSMATANSARTERKKKPELMPCPFCGDKDPYFVPETNPTGNPAVLCHCGGCMTVMMRDEWTKKTVIDKWNTRDSDG